MGEKCQTFDYLVELVDAGEKTPFFFIQVKTTRKGFTKTQTPPRLRINVSAKDVRRMAAYPVPTYLVGVHENAERAFIVSIHEPMSEAIPSITTAHELTCERCDSFGRKSGNSGGAARGRIRLRLSGTEVSL